MAQKIKKMSKSKKKETIVKKSGASSGSGKTARKATVKPKASISKKKEATSRKTVNKASKSKQGIHKESIRMEVKSKKSSPSPSPAVSVAAVTPGLLRQTKSTAAALSHLEKGIELIFKKEFRKALGELNSLCQSFPGETEILARARSYILICTREEASRNKHEANADQLYALGVMEHNKSNYDEAIAYYEQSLKSHPRGDYIYYSIAASLAMKGDLLKSMENLKKAIELNEDSRIYARNDDDFSALQDNDEFAELLGILNPAADHS